MQNKRKTNASTIFARHAAFYPCFAGDADDIHTPEEPWLFWLREKPEDPQFELDCFQQSPNGSTDLV